MLFLSFMLFGILFNFLIFSLLCRHLFMALATFDLLNFAMFSRALALGRDDVKIVYYFKVFPVFMKSNHHKNIKNKKTK